MVFCRVLVREVVAYPIKDERIKQLAANPMRNRGCWNWHQDFLRFLLTGLLFKMKQQACVPDHSSINRAARRAISTAKLVPRSQGYTCDMLAK